MNARQRASPSALALAIVAMTAGCMLLVPPEDAALLPFFAQPPVPLEPAAVWLTREAETKPLCVPVTK